MAAIRLTVQALVALVFFITGMAAKAEDPASEAQQIDAFIGDRFAPAVPGAVILAARDGKVVFRKAYGMADLENAVPMTPEKVFKIASLTKQFTAAAILNLADSGKLQLSDLVGLYVDDLPDALAEVSIAQLLSHTGGVKDYLAVPGFLAAHRREKMAPKDLIAVFKDQPLDFAPGTDFRYSNSGYVLLGAVIEKVTGDPYGSFIERQLLTPIGMRHSRFDTVYAIVPDRVHGYGAVPGSAGEIENADFISPSIPYAAGGLLSSVDDLYLWYRALKGGRAVSTAAYEAMITPAALENGKTAPYGYGLGLTSVGGAPAVESQGSISGFATHMLWLRNRDIFVVVLMNRNPPVVKPGLLAEGIADILLGGTPNPLPAPEGQARSLP